MRGTHLRQGWGQGIQLPFATGDIFLKHKSNPRIKPQHYLTACIAHLVWPLPAHLAMAPRAPAIPAFSHPFTPSHSPLPLGLCMCCCWICWNTLLSSPSLPLASAVGHFLTKLNPPLVSPLYHNVDLFFVALLMHVVFQSLPLD